MRFGEIIKKAWHITWHYRWLWVLGVFAGVTGGSGGGGGGGNTNFSRTFGSGSGNSGTGSAMPDWSTIGPLVQHWLPFALVAFVLLFLIGLAFAVVGIGARGGLVWAVNEIEEGRSPRLGEAWNAGFGRFWSLFGLGLLLQLPIVIAALLLGALILVPIFGPLMRGATPNAAAVIAPMCGVLAIGIPLLIVAGFILGIMYITGQRFIVLNGMPTMQAASESWRAFRARLGDHALMYFISLGLGIAASLALAIPIVLISLGTIVPAVLAATGKNWGLFAGMVAVFIALVFVISLLFSGVWGTFTSALWTIFFRRLTGREVLTPSVSPVAHQVPPAFAPPAPPAYPQPTPPVYPQTAPPTYPQPTPPAPPAPPMYQPPTPPAAPTSSAQDPLDG